MTLLPLLLSLGRAGGVARNAAAAVRRRDHAALAVAVGLGGDGCVWVLVPKLHCATSNDARHRCCFSFEKTKKQSCRTATTATAAAFWEDDKTAFRGYGEGEGYTGLNEMQREGPRSAGIGARLLSLFRR